LFFLASLALNAAAAQPLLTIIEFQWSSQVPSVVHHMNADRRQGAEFKGRRQSDDPANALFAITGPFAALTDPVLLFEGTKITNGNIAGLDVAHDPEVVNDLREAVLRVQQDNVSDRVTTPTLINKRERMIEFEVTPWGSTRALAIGRDITIAAGIQDALRVSRERYRNLLLLAADCVWETDSSGNITMIAPNDIFGKPASSFIGGPVQELLTSRTSELFSGSGEPQWIPAAIQSANGELMLGAAIMETVIDPDTGKRTGVRGCFRQKYGVANR